MSTSTRRLFTLAALTFALAIVASPALADRGTIQHHVVVGTVDMYGMTETSATATISQEASLTRLPALRFTSAGKNYSLDVRTAMRLNVATMLDQAYAASSDTTLTRNVTINYTTVSNFIIKVAGGVYRNKRNAYYYAHDGYLGWRPHIYGRRLNSIPARQAINKALLAEAASGQAQKTVPLWCTYYAPTITNAEIGRAILVDLSKRRLYLKDHSTLLKSYGVAIGMAKYPTPQGVFQIIGKVKYPTWRNPGSDWAKDMPAYIGPGPTNPLGTRALYLNSPGIRIHGTHKTWTIGTAASHGCMRVANSNIEKLYPLVPVGSKVFIVK